MESKAIIENLEVVNSQDKGVSIGENSDDYKKFNF